MSETDSPASVHVLRPRKISVSRKLDNFLDTEGLALSGKPTPNEDTRPRADNVNAMRCAACYEVEYLTRDYCRCGHYLGGQLEDEYLAWEQGIRANHTRLSAEVERALRPLRIFYGLAIPFMLVPLLYLVFWSDSFALSTLLWWSPAMLLAGAGMFAESHIIRPLKESSWLVENYTFENFIEQRPPGQIDGM